MTQNKNTCSLSKIFENKIIKVTENQNRKKAAQLIDMPVKRIKENIYFSFELLR